MKRTAVILVAIVAISSVTVFAQPSPIKVKKEITRHGPEKGSLIIIGGNVASTASIWQKFTELAGGKEKAKLVVVTAAGGDSAGVDFASVEIVKKETGIKDVTLLHTNDLKEANSEKFVAVIKQATGVYFMGGRQWYIADSYLNTLTHQAFFDLLNRGGVIAGSSAGASIQGSFLWRGDTKGAQILVGDHTQGLAFLKNSVIDQHLLKRNRQFDLVDFIKGAPELIGIGLDEATAIVVQGDTFEVIGKSYVVVYDYNTIMGKGASSGSNENNAISKGPFFFLSEGQKYDLKNRKIIAPARVPGSRPAAATN